MLVSQHTSPITHYLSKATIKIHWYHSRDNSSHLLILPYHNATTKNTTTTTTKPIATAKMAFATASHSYAATSQPTKMAHGMPIPASMANFDFSKCDPCRRRKKGPCSGVEPCKQCLARGRPDECSRDFGKKMLKDELAKTNTFFNAPEPAAKTGRKRAATTTNLENENKNANEDNHPNISSPPPALSTRLATTKAGEKARKEAEEAAEAAEPQFEFKLPKALENWDHNKCDRCRKIKAACDGTEPCPNCIAREAECTKKEGIKTFSIKRADELARQKHKFDEVSPAGLMVEST